MREDFDTAQDFLDYFEHNQRFTPRSMFDTTAIGVNGVVFRGQEEAGWALLPKAHRSGNPLSGFAPQTPGRKKPRKADTVRYLGWQLHAELRAVHLFLETADKLGFATPIDYSLINQHRSLVSSAIEQDGFVDSTPFPDERLLPGIALAQHQGVPTRLLDWSESPLVAAFFAAYEVVRPTAGRPRKPGRMAVITLSTTAAQQTDRIGIVQAPRHANNNLRVQQGLFTYIKDANKVFCRSKQWPSLDDIDSEMSSSRSLITRVTLPRSEAKSLLKLLWRFGVSRHELLPSLHTAARAFKYNKLLFEKS